MALREGYKRVEICAALPPTEICADDTIYVWKPNQGVFAGEERGVKLICPCGCGEAHFIPTNPDKETETETEWIYSIRKEDNAITILPSIRHTNCGAHYFIKRNRVEQAD